MKTLILHTENESQTSSIVKLANSLHIQVQVMDDEETGKQLLLKLAVSSFAKEWDSEENSHWDAFLKKAKDVSKR